MKKTAISKNVEDFYNLIKVENHRYKSWEHCFYAFQKSSNKYKDDDYLSLQLAFYLASWGMYRGSSKLLQKDYKIHLGAVDIIKNKNYDSIRFDSNMKIDKNKIGLIQKAYKELTDYYSQNKNDISPTKTLITKILLGTLGCVPAYDRYLMIGLKENKIKQSPKTGLEGLFDFVLNNFCEFEELQKQINVGKIYYPLMKIVDMYFWEVGFQIEETKKRK